MNTPPGPDERRQHERIDLKLRVHIAQLGEVDGALTNDLSAGGLFVSTKIPHGIGSCLPVRLIDPQTAEQIPTICEVVRQVRGDDGKVMGLGLRFIHLDDGLRGRLHTLIGGGITASEPIGPADVERAATASSEVLAAVPLDSIPTRRAGDVPPDLDPMLLHLLPLIDSQRSALTIAAISGLTTAECLTGLHTLAQRNLIDVAVDLDAAIIEEAVPLAPKQQEVSKGFVAQKARDYVTDAVRAQRAGRVADAISLLEQALALKPPNAADIHVRLARMAVGPLDDVALARSHVEKLKELAPTRATVTKLVAEIDAREGEISSGRKRRARPARARSSVGRAPLSPMRMAGGALALAGLVAAVGYLAWYFWLPHGPQPQTVDPATIANVFPSHSAQLLQDRLYVRVSGEWVNLSLEQKRERLGTLAEWARSEHAVKEVLVSDAVPTLVGRVHGDAVTVYR